MNAGAAWNDLLEFVNGLVSLGTLRQLGVLVACLAIAWALAWQLRRSLRVGNATVLFGRNIFDGVLFPVLALGLALVARGLFETPSRRRCSASRSRRWSRWRPSA